MAEINELDELYTKAQSALKAKEYNQASTFLKQIMLLDENYKDASRLLALTVKLKRRRWYNDARIWGAAIVISALALLVWLATKIPFQVLFSPPATPTVTNIPALAASPTITSSPTPPLIPLAWKRIYIGQVFARDTVTAIIVDPTDPEVMYAGTEDAGIYKSIDGGISWGPAQIGLQRSDVSSLIIDPEDPDTLYAGMVLGGVYKTTDGAETWQSINNGLEVPGGPFLATVAMDPANSKHLYFTDSLGLSETLNGGESWTRLQLPSCPKIITGMAILPGTPNTIYIADREKSDDCNLGIYRSRDGGATWEPIPIRENIFLQLHYRSLTIASGPEERIFISGEVLGRERFFRTMDRGQYWEHILDQSCDSLFVDPNQSGKLYCASQVLNQLLFSQDWGDSWMPILSGKDIRVITNSPHSEDMLIVGGVGSGLLISPDGGATWSERNNGLGGVDVLLKIPPFDQYSLFAEAGDRIYRSTDAGLTWGLLTNQGSGLAFDADGKTMYIQSDVILMSDDGGESWNRMTKTNQNISSFIAHPQITNLIIAIHNSGYSLSLDRGQSWDQTNNVAWGAETKEIPGTIYSSLFPDSTGLNFYILINGETTSKIFHLEAITGAWYICQLPDNLTNINLLAIDSRDAMRTIASSPGNGLLISSDGCHSWTPSNTGLSSPFVNTIAIDPNDPDTIYAGTDGGAYVTFDGGQTWNQINNGLLGATVVYSIVVDKDSNVYAATPYGIFKLEGK